MLFYGVTGALALRGFFVCTGVELMRRFEPVMYVFAALLLITAVHMLMPRRSGMHPERNWLVRIARVVFPVVNRYEGDNFFIEEDEQRKATSLFVALVAIEAMDLVFAADSVPAVLWISRDTFIAYTSNAFAILGLRALFFVVSAALTKIRYLDEGLAVILFFMSAKMFLGKHIAMSTGLSLGVIAGVLLITIATSFAVPNRKSTADT